MRLIVSIVLVFFTALLAMPAWAANLGRETVGAADRPTNGIPEGLRVTMPVDAAAGITITAYLSDTGGAGENWRAALIQDADKQTVLCSTTVRTDISTAGWYTFTGNTCATYDAANAEVFVITVTGDNGGADKLVIQDDAGLDGWTGSANITTLDPLVLGAAMSADTARDYSIYLTYTAAAGTVTTPGQLIMGSAR